MYCALLHTWHTSTVSWGHPEGGRPRPAGCPQTMGSHTGALSWWWHCAQSDLAHPNTPTPECPAMHDAPPPHNDNRLALQCTPTTPPAHTWARAKANFTNSPVALQRTPQHHPYTWARAKANLLWQQLHQQSSCRSELDACHLASGLTGAHRPTTTLWVCRRTSCAPGQPLHTVKELGVQAQCKHP